MAASDKSKSPLKLKKVNVVAYVDLREPVYIL